MRIGFVGGASGGHFYPLIAVAEKINATNTNARLYYFGPTPYNQDILDANNIKFVKVPAGKVRRYFSLLNFFDFFKTIGGLFVAWVKLYQVYPDIIFSKGGFTSVPVILMARFYRIPVVIHESDSKPGRASLLAKKFAKRIAISYPEAAQYFPPEKTALTGIPLREEIISTVNNAHEMLGIPKDLPLIYVTGGSSGAERINNLTLNSLNELLPHYRIFHQAGEENVSRTKQTSQALIQDPELLGRYYIGGHLPVATVAALLSAADLVISRAGSTSIAEIALHGKPAIIIPIPEEISHDQRTNAYAYARTGAASVLEEGNTTEHLLEAEIKSILSDTNRYESMAAAARNFTNPNAAKQIADLLISIGYEH